jgi:hypothetical protein
MRRLVLTLSLFALLTPLTSQAKCIENFFVIKKLKVQVLPYRDHCAIMVSPSETHDLVYRDYSFFDSGHFMVFNSLGEGPDATTTGARTYYLYPHLSDQMSVSQPDADTIVVQPASRQKFMFSASLGKLIEIENTKWAEDPEVRGDNNGGLEILQYPDLMMDSGWQLGNLPISLPDRLSEFKDAFGGSCKIKNNDLFNYLPLGHLEEKYPTDVQLYSFLKNRCSQLQLPATAPAK